MYKGNKSDKEKQNSADVTKNIKENDGLAMAVKSKAFITKEESSKSGKLMVECACMRHVRQPRLFFKIKC